MNITDTARKVVRETNGGVEAIALRLGKSASTLEKELRAAPGYKLGAEDLAAIADLAKEAGTPNWQSIPNAFCLLLGTMVELPVRDVMPQQELHVRLATMVKESSDVLSEATAAMADGRISDNERRRIETAVAEAIDALQRVHQGIRSVHAASKPAALREVA